LSSIDLCFSFGGGGQKNEHFNPKRKRKNQVPHCFDSCEVQWSVEGLALHGTAKQLPAMRMGEGKTHQLINLLVSKL
jgi:hypothetical protein